MRAFGQTPRVVFGSSPVVGPSSYALTRLREFLDHIGCAHLGLEIEVAVNESLDIPVYNLAASMRTHRAISSKRTAKSGLQRNRCGRHWFRGYFNLLMQRLLCYARIRTRRLCHVPVVAFSHRQRHP